MAVCAGGRRRRRRSPFLSLPFDPAFVSSTILALSLVLFISEKVRHDLVAVIALLAALVFGIVGPKEALAGFSDPAVIAVAAVLVVGRAVELSGIAAAFTRRVIPEHAPFPVRLVIVMVVGAVLSAFMNNIAALVITMPIATQVAIDSRRSPSAALMPLAFATILGGMTTLIGTPANLILSSIRQNALGEPFSFFQMTPVASCVAAAGLLYMAVIGWRLLPEARAPVRAFANPWRIFELDVPLETDGAELRAALRKAGSRLLASFDSVSQAIGGDRRRVLVLSRKDPWELSDATGTYPIVARNPAADATTVRAAVAHGSFLIGQRHEAVTWRSGQQLRVVAAGPRAAHERLPLSEMEIQPGDQLFIHGPADQLGAFIANARLLEIGRLDTPPVDPSRAAAIVGIFAAAIVGIVAFDLSPAIAFFGAAVILAATRLIPTSEVYRSIDWPVVILLAAMIPVGQSFEATGAVDILSQHLSAWLGDANAFFTFAAIGAATLLLSALLNNVATAIIMGPLAIQMSEQMGFAPDAGLIMVLIAASSDFLTPIGHQNNLLVMGPGGYRFSDYARMGVGVSVIVIGVAAWLLSRGFG